jgi:hypothetical protein
MSEYQYYEFQTIDRPLSEQEQKRGRQAEVRDRLARLRQEHARKPTLLQRLKAAGLLTE